MTPARLAALEALLVAVKCGCGAAQCWKILELHEG